MTTTALRAIDTYGGVDNYLLALDEEIVNDSNYVKKWRDIVAAALFHQSKLNVKTIKRLGFDKQAPPVVSPKADRDEKSSELLTNA
jgi:hypothetical protein